MLQNLAERPESRGSRAGSPAHFSPRQVFLGGAESSLWSRDPGRLDYRLSELERDVSPVHASLRSGHRDVGQDTALVVDHVAVATQPVPVTPIMTPKRRPLSDMSSNGHRFGFRD